MIWSLALPLLILLTPILVAEEVSIKNPDTDELPIQYTFKKNTTYQILIVVQSENGIPDGSATLTTFDGRWDSDLDESGMGSFILDGQYISEGLTFYQLAYTSSSGNYRNKTVPVGIEILPALNPPPFATDLGWSHRATLFAEDDPATSAALSDSGLFFAVGLSGEQNIPDVFMYVRNGDTWSNDNALRIDVRAVKDVQSYPDQETSVALSASGDILVRGAWGYYDMMGFVYVFRKNLTDVNHSWSFESRIVGNDAIGNAYQCQVALSGCGDTLAVGGYGDNSYQGAVWIHIQTEHGWLQQAKLVGFSELNPSSYQGKSIGLSKSGDLLVIGSSNGIFVFTRTGNNWAQGEMITGVRSPIALSGNGNVIVANAVQEETTKAGCCLFNTTDGKTWVRQVQEVLIPVDQFDGSSVLSLALSNTGDLLAMGVFTAWSTVKNGALWFFSYSSKGDWVQQGMRSNSYGFNAGLNAPEVVSFSREGDYVAIATSGSSWLLEAKIPVFVPTVGLYPMLVRPGFGKQRQGTSVAFSESGTILAVAAPSDSIGAIYIYVYDGSQWNEKSKLISGGTVVMSASGEVVGSLSQDGFISIFRKKVGMDQWVPEGSKMKSLFQPRAMIMSGNGDTLAVSGYSDQVIIHTRIGNTWILQAQVKGSDEVGNAWQGTGGLALSKSGDLLIIGGFNDDNGKGAIWVFLRMGENWLQQGSKIVVPGSKALGSLIALSWDAHLFVVSGVLNNSQTIWTFTTSNNGGNWTPSPGYITNIQANFQSLSLNNVGNIFTIGGISQSGDDNVIWVYTRIDTTWIKQGEPLKLPPLTNPYTQRTSTAVTINGDGDLLAIGVPGEFEGVGAVWIVPTSGGQITYPPPTSQSTKPPTTTPVPCVIITDTPATSEAPNTTPVISPTPTPAFGTPNTTPSPTPTSGTLSPSPSPSPTPTLTPTSLSVGCSNHSCLWYRNCLEERHPCGSEGYALAYGEFFCFRYQNNAGLLTPAGNTWQNNVRICLQDALEPVIRSSSSISCSSILSSAFDSHPTCYVQNGICELSLEDYIGIGKIICGGIACPLQNLNGLFWTQVTQTISGCFRVYKSIIKVKTQTTLKDANEAWDRFKAQVATRLIEHNIGQSSDIVNSLFLSTYTFGGRTFNSLHEVHAVYSFTSQPTTVFEFEILVLPYWNASVSNFTNPLFSARVLASTIGEILQKNPSGLTGHSVESLFVDNVSFVSTISTATRAVSGYGLMTLVMFSGFGFKFIV